MPILIVNHSQQLHGLLLNERVLIGRRPFTTIRLADPAVSRLHAWIGRRDGRWVLFDAGSRTGTFVNAQTLKTPHPLNDADEIRIGQAVITYHDTDELPGDVAPLDTAPPPPTTDPYDGGIYFDCACGGPMWVAANMAGTTGRCRYCGERLVVPHMSGGKARPLAPPTIPRPAAPAPPKPPKKARPADPVAPPAPPIAPPATSPPSMQTGVCSICQTPIHLEEEVTSCPSCHLTFHHQCWEENLGCGAYGCDQVNALAPAPSAKATEEGGTLPATPALDYSSPGNAKAGSPWPPVLLALSFVAMALGALAFGIPSAIMLAWALVFLFTRKPWRKGMVVAAVLVSIVGALAGYATSMFWWKQVKVWEMFLK